MRVCYFAAQIALQMLHGSCTELVFGRIQKRENIAFPCTVAGAGDERQLLCEACAGWDRFGGFFLPQSHGGLQ